MYISACREQVTVYDIISQKLWEFQNILLQVDILIPAFSNKQVRDCSVTGEGSSILALRVQHFHLKTTSRYSFVGNIVLRYPTCILLFPTRWNCIVQVAVRWNNAAHRRWNCWNSFLIPYLADVVFFAKWKLFYKFAFSTHVNCFAKSKMERWTELFLLLVKI